MDTTYDEKLVTTETGISPRWEIRFGISLAIFAAILALNDMGAGRYGEDELKLTNEKSGQFLWYQSKGIKESLAEGQQALLETLLSSGSIAPAQREKLTGLAAKMKADVARYKKEKKEILLGSAAVGEKGWAQDIDGQMGKVVGAKELEAHIDRLSQAGDRFDLATLLLQIALVVGAIGLLLKELPAKRVALFALLTLGVAGTTFSILGYALAWSV